ncbi:MAG: hypothetical protein LBU04_07230 [Christensenellaceae bacterium]|jgi:hypothetical protein|nr:hypothetical protein [Christensenellaceae bacterium]
MEIITKLMNFLVKSLVIISFLPILTGMWLILIKQTSIFPFSLGFLDVFFLREEKMIEQQPENKMLF